MTILRGLGPDGSPLRVNVDSTGTLYAGSSHTDTDALVTHSAASTGVNGDDQINLHQRGVAVVVDITTLGGVSPTLTVAIEGKDKASNKYYALLTSAALSAVGTTLLTVYPGVTASANVAASSVLPAKWRVRTTIGGTTPAVTATVGACTLV